VSTNRCNLAVSLAPRHNKPAAILFRDVLGKLQVWIRGRLDGEKMAVENGDIIVRIQLAMGRELSVVVIAAAALGETAGLGGIVTMEVAWLGENSQRSMPFFV
jgi:hypothetical protein